MSYHDEGDHLALGGGIDDINIEDDNDEGAEEEEDESDDEEDYVPYVPPVDVIIDGINYGDRDDLTEITLPNNIGSSRSCFRRM